MKTAPPINIFILFTLCELHQLWQALILTPFELGKCILHYWKAPVFNYLDAAVQGHTCVLDNWKPFVNDPRFISYNREGVYLNVSECTLQMNCKYNS